MQHNGTCPTSKTTRDLGSSARLWNLRFNIFVQGFVAAVVVAGQQVIVVGLRGPVAITLK
jgi:hypothetical protein